MGVQQYRVDFDAQTDKHQSWGQANSSEVVNLFIEHVRVITTTAAHENKAQSDKGDTDEHEHVVLFLENEFLIRLLICF